MQAGIQQEPAIVKDYLAQQAQNGDNNITIDKFSLFVSKTHLFLGASPDGTVSGNESSGLLEMKDIQMEAFETLRKLLSESGSVSRTVVSLKSTKGTNTISKFSNKCL